MEESQRGKTRFVLSDVLMPGMSGTDLYRSIKNNPETCHIPVVLLTARTTLQQNMEGLYSGADDYISKPFNINILVARCNDLVNNRPKDITGQAPGDFILTVRLRYTARMLNENPKLNISEISDRAGFSSPRQFSKFFKTRYGTIPQQWRKS